MMARRKIFKKVLLFIKSTFSSHNFFFKVCHGFLFFFFYKLPIGHFHAILWRLSAVFFFVLVLAPDLTFPIKKSLYNITVTLNASAGIPIVFSYRTPHGNASLCLIGRRRERVDKYFNEVRKL